MSTWERLETASGLQPTSLNQSRSNEEKKITKNTFFFILRIFSSVSFYINKTNYLSYRQDFCCYFLFSREHLEIAWGLIVLDVFMYIITEVT